MEQIYIPKQDYKVLVRCFTYNQSKYIEDALNGFAMQQTEFPFVCLVMDDCSTDGEQEVIKEWMERECDMVKAEYIDFELSNVILVPHKTNPTCSFAFYLLKQNLWREDALKRTLVAPWREHCEYEALCEGDDYWIDEIKLQKQVDFLDSNPDYALCYSPVKYFFQNSCHLSQNVIGGNAESFESLLFANTISTPSTLYRKQMELKYEEEIKPGTKNWKMGDYPRWLYFAYNSKVKCMSNEVFAVYRVLNESASHSTNINKKLDFINSSYEICLWFNKKYNEKYENEIRKKKQTYKTLCKGIIEYWPNLFVVKNYFYFPYYICKKAWSII